jgi:DNA modification methylase
MRKMGDWKNRIVSSGQMDPRELHPNPRNWRRHPKGQALALEGVLEEVGWIQDVIVNQRTGRLIDGHLRVELAVKKKEKEIPVKYVDLSEEEEDKALLTLDPISSMAEADKDMLQSLLQSVKSDDERIKNLINEIGHEYKVSPKTVKEDNYEPPAEIETDIKRGDIIQLGRHRVMCGDSTSKEDVGRLMDGRTADMVFTDPPYNVDYGSSGRIPRHKIRKILNDKQCAGHWESFCKDVFDNIKTYSDGDIYLWGAPGPEGMKMRLWLVGIGAHWSATIIWVKDQLVLSHAKYQRKYEPCFYGWFGKSSYNGDRTQTEVWEVPRPKSSELHPTMKPVELCGIGIRNSSNENSTVMDLFLGSGSTLIACEQLDRICYGMEISPQYCEVICQRWEKLTGGKRQKT